MVGCTDGSFVLFIVVLGYFIFVAVVVIFFIQLMFWPLLSSRTLFTVASSTQNSQQQQHHHHHNHHHHHCYYGHSYRVTQSQPLTVVENEDDEGRKEKQIMMLQCVIMNCGYTNIRTQAHVSTHSLTYLMLDEE